MLFFLVPPEGNSDKKVGDGRMGSAGGDIEVEGHRSVAPYTLIKTVESIGYHFVRRVTEWLHEFP